MANVKDLLVNGSARVIGTIYGNATSANKVNHSLTFGSKSFNGSSAQTITLADLGGKPTQSAVSSPSASGTAISFIDTISQNANGVITATKKTVRDASASQSGVVNTGTQSFKGNKTLDDGMLIIKPAGRSSWQEGIRILSANNGWTTIALGGSATSGTDASTWSMHTYQSNFYLAHSGSSSSSTGILQSDASGNWRIDNSLGVGGKDTNYKLYVNGTSYFSDNISIKAGKEIKSVGTKATSSMIRFLNNASDAYGNGISIGGGGVTILGAGESASSLSVAAGTETLYLLSDGTINVEANADTIANRIGFQVTQSGNLVPVKAEATNNNAQSLGSSGNRWSKLFVGTADSYGSATRPIYWNAGVPTICNSTLDVNINGTATHFSNNAFRTKRDFENGTLITTDLSGGTANSAIPFYLEIVGNGYGNGLVAAYCQGYVYQLGNGHDKYVNCDAYSTGKSFTNTIYAFSDANGKLCFWFARMAYWQGFDIKVYDTSENINTKKLTNHVVSVSDVALPTTRSWETQITVRQTAFIGTGSTDSRYVLKSGDTMSGSLHSNIGTHKLSSATAPAHFIGNLHLYSSAGSGGAITDGNTNAITFGGSSTSAYAGIYSPSSGAYGNYLMFATTNLYADGAKTRMVIDPSGKTGIGTTSPSYKLHVAGDIYADGGWLRTYGNYGWYSQSYGGGLYMTDSTYIRNYNGKSTRLDNLCLGADNNSYRLYVNGTTYVTSQIKSSNSWISIAGTSSFTCPDGTAITQPGGANPMVLYSGAASNRDCGIFYLSNDNAYIANSSDNAYTFGVFDTDITQNFSTESNASLCVRSGGSGTFIRSRLGVNGINDSYNLYVKGTSYLAGKTYINTSSGTSPFYIARGGSESEAVAMSVDDATYTIAYTNDETFNQIRFRLINTDTEDGTKDNTTDSSIYLNSSYEFYPEGNNVGSIGLSSRKWANIYATTFHGSLDGNASSATKATQDSDGNAINSTYLKKRGLVETSQANVTSGSSAGTSSALILYGTTYGNDAAYLKTSGKMSYGDPGPQIQFSSVLSGGQRGALIFTDHDTIGAGVSLSLVSTESDAWFIAPHIKALTGFVGNLSGNASTATKLQTARTISLSNDASGSTSFDGSSNATISATVNRLTCNPAGRPTSANLNLSISPGNNKLSWIYSSSSMTTGKPPTGDGIILNGTWDWGGYGCQLACSNTGHISVRGASNIDDSTSSSSYNSTWGSWYTVLDTGNYSGTLDSRYIKKSGDTMTGTLGLVADKYNGPSGAHGMNCNNSDIVGVNGIFTADNAETFSEGLNFYRSSTTWDAMTASGGTFYFGSNVAFGAGLTGSANIAAGAATFHGCVFADRGGTAAPSFRWNKSGTYWGGIGYNGVSNENYFGPCDANGNWVAIGSTGAEKWRFAGQLIIQSPTSSSAAYDSTNPTITFMNSDKSQNCSLVYTDYDAVRAPAGITLIGNQGDEWFQASKVYGAVWNDYAEFRQSDTTEPGRVVIENGDGTLSLSTKRLQRGAEVISDTYGFAIGETDECKTPIAATGRVLAYTYEPVEEYRSKTGWPVCSGPNGTVSIMTEEEEEKYPSRIIGTISEVPDYEEWGSGKVKTNRRVWIRIK